MSEYQYNKVTPEMIEKFKEIAPKRVLVGDEINEDFTHDEMAIYGKARPEVLVEATSTEEVAAVVKLCNENMFLRSFLNSLPDLLRIVHNRLSFLHLSLKNLQSL